MRSGILRHLPLHIFVVASLLVTAVGCELDFVNPNSSSEEQVLTTTEGIRNLTVGMQESYATNALGETIIVTGTTSRELSAENSQQNFVDLNQGGTSLPNTNADVEAIWSANYRVVGMAEDVIDNAPKVGFTAETESGILATAHLFKAMALGNVAMAFQEAPTTTSRRNDAQFVTRQEVLAEAVSQLSDARTTVNETSPSDDFYSEILAVGPSGADAETRLLNTINAYLARFNLLAGNDQAAIDAANRVDPSVVPQFSYDDQSQNPVWNQLISLSNFAPRDSFGTSLTQPGDQRIAFYTTPLDATSGDGLGNYPIEQIDGFWTSASSSIPLYVPGELPLIRAEAKLNQGASASEIVSEINAVRTKAPSEDPLGIGAGLSGYSGGTSDAELREEILRQRRAELYLQGLALADSRRLGPEVSDRQNPGAFERNRNFYPYPAQERRNNQNTPADPDF